MSLGPTSRFPLGLLDLLGVKQMGQYPRSMSEEMIPTIEVLRMLCASNSSRTITDLPLNMFDADQTDPTNLPILENLGEPLVTGPNEALIITAWSMMGSVLGAGGIVPDSSLGYRNSVTGGQAMFFSNTAMDQVGNVAVINGGAVRVTYVKADPDCMIYIPPNSDVIIHLASQAISVAGGDALISTNLNFIRLRT